MNVSATTPTAPSPQIATRPQAAGPAPAAAPKPDTVTISPKAQAAQSTDGDHDGH